VPNILLGVGNSVFCPGQNILGVSYPFELLKNKTLDFFSRTLPILKADDTLPKVNFKKVRAIFLEI
jgi:hypothetical protein